MTWNFWAFSTKNMKSKLVDALIPNNEQTLCIFFEARKRTQTCSMRRTDLNRFNEKQSGIHIKSKIIFNKRVFTTSCSLHCPAKYSEPKTGEAFSMSLYYKLLWLTLEKTRKNTFSINWHDMTCISGTLILLTTLYFCQIFVTKCLKREIVCRQKLLLQLESCLI